MSAAPSEVWTDEGFCKVFAAFLQDIVGKILSWMDSFPQKTRTLHQSFALASFWVRSVHNSSQLKTEATRIFPKAWFSNLFRLPSHLLFCSILCHCSLSYSSPTCIYCNSFSLPQTSAFLRLQLLILFILHNSFIQKEIALFPHGETAHSVQILQLLFAISLAQRKCHILQGAAEQKALGVWKTWKAEKSLGRISWGFTPWEEVWAILPLSKKGLAPIYMGFRCFQGQEVASGN